MEKLFDETFATEEPKVINRHLWYGYLDLYIDGEDGKQIVLNDKLENFICETIQKNVQEKVKPMPTEINWYLYGKTQTTDAINDKIRPTIMVRYKNNKFLVRCNISDHDFAINIDEVLAFEKRLEKHLLELQN